MQAITDMVKNYLVSKVVDYPWGSVAVVAIAGLQVAMTPLMQYLQNLINKSGNQKLIADMNAVEKSKTWSVVVYVVHLFTSINITTVQQAVAVTQNPTPAPTDSSKSS